MKKKFLLLISFVLSLFICEKYCLNANAIRKDLIEVYIETGPVLEKKKVYLTDELAYFLQDSQLEIFDEPETKGVGIFEETIHHYYYMASRYIDEIVYSRKIDDSMDSVVYMVKQLEFYAATYKLGHNTSKTVNDLVLGYLRCINIDYSEASTMYDGLTELGFSILCGSYEEEFVNYVKNEDGKKKDSFGKVITIAEFFGRYVKKTKFNITYGTRNDYGKSVIDPIEKNKIDISHFFCVIDALRHVNRNIPVMIGFHLVSWLGDLHQATYIRNVPGKMYEPVDFKSDVLDNDGSCFEMEDFIADIDGYNIGFAILTNNKNSDLKLSDAINSYYEMLQQNNKNRYRIFIKSVAFGAEFLANGVISTEVARTYINYTKNTGKNGFIFAVCINMGVACDGYTNIEADFYYNKNNPIFKFMCKNGEEEKEFPCLELRANMARAFSEYILCRA